MLTDVKRHVVEVKPEGTLSLSVRFSDGTRGKVRFEPSHFTGVFAALNDPGFFRKAYIDGGSVVGPGEIDLAPDAMFDAINANDEWVLR